MRVAYAERRQASADGPHLGRASGKFNETIGLDEKSY
jgi:hypothetical protein